MCKEFIAEFDPVSFWISNMMCIEIAGCATKFSHEGNADELFHLVLYPFGEYHDLFAQFGRAGGLAMRMGEHRNVFPIFCKKAKLSVEVEQGREIFIFDAVFPGKRDSCIVNVL